MPRYYICETIMICPICQAILENYEDTRYCSKCGNYIYEFRSNFPDKTSFTNRTRNKNTEEKKKNYDWIPIVIMIIFSILLFLSHN